MISVIIPIYKSELYLEQAILSILGQRNVDIELILVNDDSPDNSEEVCSKYLLQDKRVKYIKQLNQGPAHAMNNGVRASSGEFIMFLDGDDWIDKNCLDEIISAQLNSNADIVFWNYIKEFGTHSERVVPFCSEATIFEGKNLALLQRRVVGLINDELYNISKFDQISSGWGKLYRRDLFDQDEYCLVGIDGKDNFDTELIIRLFAKSTKILFINRDFNHYRMYNINSLTKTYKGGLFAKQKHMFLSLFKFLEQNESDESSYLALNNRIATCILNNILSITSPNNNTNIFRKFRLIREILHDDLYKNSIRKFQFRFVRPVHFIFFKMCRWKFALGILCAAFIIRKLK
jgi:glycosyltransferase involved in cell wall biosynthesis